MVLIDTSVWVEHFRKGEIGLEALLNDSRVSCHPFIVGELACWNLKKRTEILSLLHTLPVAIPAEHEEVMRVIEKYRLMGKGLGYVDMHLLASAMLTNISLWTLDERFYKVSSMLGIAYRP